jgi:hypothetical protein
MPTGASGIGVGGPELVLGLTCSFRWTMVY